MTTKKLKTTTGYISLNMPKKLEEVTLGQLMAMQSAEKLSDLEAISILSGVPLNDLQNIVDVNDLQICNDGVLSIAHQIKHLYNSNAIPKDASFNIDGQRKSVKVIKNLSIEPAGAFMASREIIADEIAKHVKENGEDDWQESFSPSLKACAQILAEYFYCPASGKPYNEYAVADFKEQVKRLPVTDALPIAKYFFLNYQNLSKPKTGFWHRLLRRWNSARV